MQSLLGRSKSSGGSPLPPGGAPPSPGRPQQKGASCMPWMVGVTVLQTVLIIGVVAKLASMAVRWEYDHAGSHLARRHASRNRLRREFEGSRRWGQTDYSGGDDAQGAKSGGSIDGDYAGDEGGGAGSGGARLRGGDGDGDGGKGSSLHNPLVEEDPKLHHEAMSTWPYTCWTPREGMSEPRLTMVTVIDGLPHRYQKAVWHNRMQYAAKWGHRYCELQMHDRNKIPAFTKLPWILALAPCTDFIIHLDADAMLAHLHLPFSPWVQFMQSKNIDQLFSQDCIPDSAINYGVFMVRTASWLWNFYRKIYNMCTCDWSRMHDWPAEQGIVYDLIASQLDSFETQRSLIVPGKGWNHILSTPEEHLEEWDVINHLTWPNSYPENHTCWDNSYRKSNMRKCKYLGLEFYMTNVIGTHGHNADLNLTAHFVEEENNCQQVRQNSLFVSKTTYSNQHDALPGSVLDFDVDPATGQVLGVKVSEIGCLGYREKKCSLPSLWDGKRGTGPWEIYKQDIV